MVCLIGICLSIFFSLELLRQMPNQFVTLLIALQIAWRTDAIFCSIEIRKFGKKKSIDLHSRPDLEGMTNRSDHFEKLLAPLESIRHHFEVRFWRVAINVARESDIPLLSTPIEVHRARESDIPLLSIDQSTHPTWKRWRTDRTSSKGYQFHWGLFDIDSKSGSFICSSRRVDRITRRRRLVTIELRRDVFFFSLELLRQMPNQFVTLLIALQ